MTSTPDFTSVATSAVMGPIPVTSPNRLLVPMAEGELAQPAAPLVFSELLGLCSPEKGSASDTDPEESGGDALSKSSSQDAIVERVPELPFFWTPLPQFAPPLPPPSAPPPLSLLPVASAPSGENTVAAGADDGAVFSGEGALEFRQPAAGGTPIQVNKDAQPVTEALVSPEDSARVEALPVGKPFEVNIAKPASAGMAFSGFDQGRAASVTAPDMPARAGGEYIATTGAAGRFSVSQAPVIENKNIVKSIDIKKLEKAELKNGIESAYGGGIMPFVSATSMPVDSAVAPVPSAPVAGELASAAMRMVERVAEVADLVRDTPAERVTLKLDLDDMHRVEVRVLMREGRVHTEFRSDSPEVRTALSSAWADFSAKRETGDPVWAEPVFASMGAAASSSNFAEPVRAVANALPAPAKGFEPDQQPGQGGARRQAHQDLEPRFLKGDPAVIPVSAASVPNQTTPVLDRHRLLSAHA